MIPGGDVLDAECLLAARQPEFEVLHPPHLVGTYLIDDEFHDAAFSDDGPFSLKEGRDDLISPGLGRQAQGADPPLDIDNIKPLGRHDQIAHEFGAFPAGLFQERLSLQKLLQESTYFFDGGQSLVEDRDVFPETFRHLVGLPQNDEGLGLRADGELFQLPDDKWTILPEPAEILEDKHQRTRLGNGKIKGTQRVNGLGDTNSAAVHPLGAVPDIGEVRAPEAGGGLGRDSLGTPFVIGHHVKKTGAGTDNSHQALNIQVLHAASLPKTVNRLNRIKNTRGSFAFQAGFQPECLIIDFAARHAGFQCHPFHCVLQGKPPR